MQGILILSFRYIWWQEETQYIFAAKSFYKQQTFIARCAKGCDSKPHRAGGNQGKKNYIGFSKMFLTLELELNYRNSKNNFNPFLVTSLRWKLLECSKIFMSRIVDTLTLKCLQDGELRHRTGRCQTLPFVNMCRLHHIQRVSINQSCMQHLCQLLLFQMPLPGFSCHLRDRV